MNRPTPKDIFGKNATHESIMKMYADSHDLLRYAKALDDYIDWMEENRKDQVKEIHQLKMDNLKECEAAGDYVNGLQVQISELQQEINQAKF